MTQHNAEYGIPNGDRDDYTPPVIPVSPEQEYRNKIAELETTIEELKKKIDEFRFNKIDASDFRLEHIWEKAGELAGEKGYCSEFEWFMDKLGTGYSREVEGYLVIDVTFSGTVTIPASVTRVDIDNGNLENYVSERDINYHIDTDNLSIDKWTVADFDTNY